MSNGTIHTPNGRFTDADARFMRLALAEAQAAAAEAETPVGAIIVSAQGAVLGKGRNAVERLRDVTAHAEILALSAAAEALGAKYLTDCTLFVTLEPCPMCAAALRWAQLGRLAYGAADEKHGYARFSPSLLHPKTQVQSGLLADDCAAILRAFFQARRQSPHGKQ